MLKRMAETLDYCKQLMEEDDLSALMEAFLVTAFITIAIVSGLTILML